MNLFQSFVKMHLSNLSIPNYLTKKGLNDQKKSNLKRSADSRMSNINDSLINAKYFTDIWLFFVVFEVRFIFYEYIVNFCFSIY